EATKAIAREHRPNALASDHAAHLERTIQLLFPRAGTVDRRAQMSGTAPFLVFEAQAAGRKTTLRLLLPFRRLSLASAPGSRHIAPTLFLQTGPRFRWKACEIALPRRPG